MKFLFAFVLVAIAYGATVEVVQIDTTSFILELDPRFVSSGWEMWSYLDNIKTLSNSIFRKIASNLGPGALRVGGITCDWVNYTVPKTKISDQYGAFWPDYERPISMDDFKALVDLAAASNLEFVFGLNELHGRNCHVNGSKCIGKWDTSNVREFLTYIRDNKVGPIFAFELGNELTVNDYHIPITENIADYITLNQIFTEIWPDKLTRPQIYGPSVDHCNSDVDLFMSQTKSFLGGFTYHSYPGENGSRLVTQEVSIQWLKENIILHDPHANSEYCIESWNRIGKPVGMHLWLTETNSAYNGINGVMNAFENSFWYLASLGQYAKTGVERHCRWAFYGGSNFAFFDTKDDGRTFYVLPDYWVAVLHKRVIGTKVLSATGTFTNGLVYAHCGKASGSVSLIVINPSTSDITLDLRGIGSTVPRDEYIFTATALSSQTVELNGNSLFINPDGSLPSALRPRTVSSGDIILPRYSYGYIVLNGANAKVCQ